MSMLKRLLYRLVDSTWCVGIVDNNLGDLINGEKMTFHRVKHKYQDRWFADPFVLEVSNDKIYLLVEEYYKPNRRGRISKMVVDRHSYELLSLKTILDIETHLSFPFIVRENGKVYICPENSEANEFCMYEYDDTKEICTKVRVIANLPLTDAVLFQINGKSIMLSTSFPYNNGNRIDVYEKNSDNQYILVSCRMFDEKIGRNAGSVFEYNNKLYRPAQECNHCYGHAISIQEMTRDLSVFKEINRIYPPNKYRFLATHTLNSYNGVVVSDVRAYKYPIFGCVYYFCRKILKGLLESSSLKCNNGV